MNVTKNLIVRGGADFSAMRKETQKAAATLSDFKRSTEKVMTGIKTALIAIGIGKVIKDSISSAMSAESSIQQLNRTLGVNAKEFQNWANTQALAFNMSKGEALKYGSVYSNLVSGFAKDTGETMKYTEDLLKSSSIIASATGRSMEDVMDRIRSGLLGNTEAIEDLGVNVNVAMIQSTDAFSKFANGRSWQQLDFQTQQQIRLMAILEQTSKKYGDTVFNNTASKMQQLVAVMKNVQLSLGQAFMPIINLVLPILTSLASKLAYVMNIIAQFSQALFGKTANQANAQAASTTKQATAVTNLGNAYKQAGQKAKGALAGFDEVNALSDNSSSGAAGDETAPAGGETGAIGAMPVEFDTNAPEISDKIQAMADKVKDAFGVIKEKFKDFAGFMVANKDIIIAATSGIVAGFMTFKTLTFLAELPAMITGIKLAVIGLQTCVLGALTPIAAALSVPVGIVAAIIVGVAALTAAFVYFYQTNDTFKGFVDGILNAIKNAAVYLWNNVLVPFGVFLKDVFSIAWDAVTKAAGWLYENVLKPLGEFLVWIWKNVLIPIGAVLADVLGVAFKFVADMAKSLWVNVLVPLGDFFKATFNPLVQALSAIFNTLWKFVLTPLATFLTTVFKAAFTGITTTIQFLWNNVLKPLVTFLSGTFMDVFNSVMGTVKSIIKGVQTVFIGLMDFITGVFTGNWKQAWEGIKGIFKGIFDSIAGVFKGAVNIIIDGMNFLIRSMNHLKVPEVDIPGLGKVGGWGVNIKEIPKLARGGIVNSSTIAQIGEAGPEMIVPLENTSFVDKLASALGTAVMSAMQFTNQSSNSGSSEVVIQVDGTSLARVLMPSMQRENSRLGNKAILQEV